MSANFTPDMTDYSGVKPFRFWCQKVLPLVYDDSLSYYELLCKVVDYVNNIISDLSVAEENIEAVRDAYSELENYVNNYFANLDVQDEINNKLDSMAADGTLGEIIEPYLNEFNRRLALQDTELAQRLGSQDSKIAVLEGRMDTFASLPAGSTSGNAELLDIRVGADGTTYQSAGDAVRGQYSEVMNKTKELDSNVNGTDVVNFSYTSGKYVDYAGDIETNADFAYSNPIKVYRGDNVEFLATGYMSNVAMISTCNDSGDDINVKVVSYVTDDSSRRVYKYTCETNGYIILSFDNRYETTLTIKRANSLVRAVFGTENVVFQYTQDHYVNNTGEIADSPGYAYSQPIKVYLGDVIDFYAAGYSNRVAMISTCDESGNNIKPVVISYAVGGVSRRNYSYTARSNGYVIVSFDYRTSFTLTITRASSLIWRNRLDYGLSLSLFERLGVIGDSFASGTLYYNSNYVDKYNISWPQILARKLGITATNYSTGGLTTRSFLSNTSRGMNYLLSQPADNLYLLVLGINDAYSLGTAYLGSIEDITMSSSYADYPDTFYGNYGKIIEMTKEHAPNAKLVMFNIANATGVYATFNNAIAEIANHYGIPVVYQNDDWYINSWLYNYKTGSHPIAMNYAGMANAFERLLVRCVEGNKDYFGDYYMN